MLQLINVMMSTTRSILTIKASPQVAAIINAVSYTFYNAIVKLITAQDMIVIIIVTFATNIIGVYLARYILNRMEKDKLWVYNATVTHEDNMEQIIKVLKSSDIKLLYNKVTDNLFSLQVFSYTQNESTLIKGVFEKYNTKFYIVESKK